MLAGLFALIGLGFVLGLRHGIDWDHIAAITDITSSAVTNTEAEVEGRLLTTGTGGPSVTIGVPIRVFGAKWSEAREGFWLATLYALGHASVVTALGLIALWLGAILPEWIDPLMERIVGVTLVLLGAWIFYSLWRYGRSFRLQSRWMVVFALAARLWAMLKHTIAGHPHTHDHAQEIAQYGPRAAFGIGMIHGSARKPARRRSCSRARLAPPQHKPVRSCSSPSSSVCSCRTHWSQCSRWSGSCRRAPSAMCTW